MWQGSCFAMLDMTVRINIEDEGSGETRVSVYGWIEGDDESDELLRVVRSSRSPVVLNLGELRAADPSGLKALNTLVSEGVQLIHVSDFIKLLLESNGDSSKNWAGLSDWSAQ